MWVTGQKDQVQNHRSTSLPSTAPLVPAEMSLPSLAPSEASGLPCHHPQPKHERMRALLLENPLGYRAGPNALCSLFYF